MKKQILTLFISVLSIVSANAQKTLADVKVEEKLTVEGKSLTLNGAGIREKLWFELYVGALYVSSKTTNAQAVIDSKDPTAIRLTITSSKITSEKMVNAVNEGFENATNNNTAALKDKIEKFKSFFKEKINPKDVFLIAYNPTTGVTVYKNGVKKGSIEGHDFKKALFGIWLGNKPADDDLKAAMLGK